MKSASAAGGSGLTPEERQLDDARWRYIAEQERDGAPAGKFIDDLRDAVPEGPKAEYVRRSLRFAYHYAQKEPAAAFGKLMEATAELEQHTTGTHTYLPLPLDIPKARAGDVAGWYAREVLAGRVPIARSPADLLRELRARHDETKRVTLGEATTRKTAPTGSGPSGGTQSRSDDLKGTRSMRGFLSDHGCGARDEELRDALRSGDILGAKQDGRGVWTANPKALELWGRERRRERRDDLP
jgi:hypothetical protein